MKFSCMNDPSGVSSWERATVASMVVRTMQKRVKIISTLLICNTTSLYSSFGQILGRGVTQMILRAPIASTEGLSGPFGILRS